MNGFFWTNHTLEPKPFDVLFSMDIIVNSIINEETMSSDDKTPNGLSLILKIFSETIGVQELRYFWLHIARIVQKKERR